MRFSSWLWEQLDTPGISGEFAKICWDDINNGCGSGKYNATLWLKHFEQKHSDKKDILIDKLTKCYMEFLKEVGDDR